MPRTAAFSFVLAVAAGCSTSPGALSPEATRELVQRDVKAMIGSLYSGDVDTILRYTHPVILGKIGTREQAKAAMEQIVQQATTSYTGGLPMIHTVGLMTSSTS